MVLAGQPHDAVAGVGIDPVLRNRPGGGRFRTGGRPGGQRRRRLGQGRGGDRRGQNGGAGQKVALAGVHRLISCMSGILNAA